jgi:hypothetical protein
MSQARWHRGKERKRIRLAAALEEVINEREGQVLFADLGSEEGRGEGRQARLVRRTLIRSVSRL